MRWRQVSIVGVGLIGGSIGLALRARGLAERVVGIGRREESLRVAQQVGAVTESTTSLEEGVRQAELIVVCTPVELVPPQVCEAARHAPAGALITDVGSTKQAIVGALRHDLPAGTRFVGSHPLAGSEKTGPADAQATLLVDRLVVVTPDEHTPATDVDAVTAFWQSLGARTQVMSPAEHDQSLAITSHLPHLAACALALATPERCLPLAASGWRDTTRVAAGDAELWAQIFATNKSHLLAACLQFDAAWQELKDAIFRGDAQRVRELLQRAKELRDRFDDGGRKS